ncbi:helix-turn-helix domain-containing protein, partial [Vibrio parahaemolyticus]
MDTESTYLTIEEVANILHLKKPTVWGMCRNGKLP